MKYALVLLFALAACGDVKSTGDAGSDAAVVAADAARLDAAIAIDAARSDVDAGPVDAAPTPDSVPTCGTIGKPCTGAGPECDTGQVCQFSVGGSFCTKDRPGCGGFAGAMCMDEGASVCAFTDGADHGPCLTPFEFECICSASPDSLPSCS